MNPVMLRKIIARQYQWHEARFQTQNVSISGSDPIPVVEPKICTVQDIYKCLHQGEFGMGHLIGDVDQARAWFKKEFEEAIPEEEEPLREIVSIDGQTLRINFRPYKARIGKDPVAREKLFQICVESARSSQGSPEHFFTLLETFLQLNQNHTIQIKGIIYAFPFKVLEGFLEGIQQTWRDTGQVPVYHHSEVYRIHNRPAYRVVNRKFLAELLPGSVG
ncbi:MAG TPA: hypothetical protein VNM22_00405 [Candidatus Limnocylindrales bacterium]|nr:hypothetical protein [Candidatus Limnocylindrales bacterium]